MNKPAKIEVGQLWRDGSNPMWGTATVVKQKADDVNRFGLQWDGTAKHNGVCWWHTDSLHALTFVGYAPHIGPQQGAGPEAGKAPTERGQCSYDGVTWIDCECWGLGPHRYSRRLVVAAPQPVPADCGAPEHAPEAKCSHGWIGGRHPLPEHGCGEIRIAELEAQYAVVRAANDDLVRRHLSRQRIQARKKPEPWRPSVDDDHWIPDV